MTGFGRTGRRWGYEHLPFQPDVLYGGKGLGGGYVPIGMVAATDDVVAPLRGSRFMYYTFTANDGACAGATAVLDVLEAEHLVERADGDGRQARPAPRRRARRAPDVRRAARARAVPRRRADPERRSPWRRPWSRECLARDMWIYPAGSGPVEDAVMIGCPLTISDGELELLVTTLRDALDAAVP